MVDINTAMAAAATERRSRGSGDKERKKSRSGADLGIEPFDPSKHVAKEKADTASMWMVMGISLIVSLVMRYIAMPGAQDNPDMLWFLPVMGIFLLPSLHRAIMPPHFVEHYTKGTWFKASFLHIFTWLAITFLLTNAPFGDIVAPQIDEGWGMIDGEEGNWNYSSSKKGAITLETGYDSGAFIVFAFADNFDASKATYSYSFDGQAVENNWSSIEVLDANALDKVRSHKDLDVPVALEIPSGLEAGEYEFKVEVSEDGDPWTNTRTITMKIVVKEPVVED
jgi:hypothetical protein